MTQDLISTAPGTYEALLGLLQTAGSAQNPAVPVYAFALGQYEAASYVILRGIENHEWEPETIGTFSQLEHYDICGEATIYTGDSPFTNPSVATSTLTSTYSLFQNVVMTPVMSNRTIPIFGANPSPYQVLPGFARYTAGPAEMPDGAAGWYGLLEFSFHLDAYVTPA